MNDGSAIPELGMEEKDGGDPHCVNNIAPWVVLTTFEMMYCSYETQ
jgi:hypothetical protein